MKKHLIYFLFWLFSNSPLLAQTPSITAISVSQRADGTGLADIHFTLSGTANAYYIAVEASFNGGNTFSPIPAGSITGDTGPISPGAGKHFIWNGLQSFPNTYSTKAKVKLNMTAITNSLKACFTYMSCIPTGGRWIWGQNVQIGDTLQSDLTGIVNDYDVPWCTSYGCCNSSSYNAMSISRHTIIANTSYRIHITGGLRGGSYFTNGTIIFPDNWVIDSVSGNMGDPSVSNYSINNNVFTFHTGVTYNGCSCSDCGRTKFNIYIRKI